MGNHSLCYEKDILTLRGVVQVVEVAEREGAFKLDNGTVVVKGSGLNIVKLDKEQGIVILETKSLSSIVYKQTPSLKGLFR